MCRARVLTQTCEFNIDSISILDININSHGNDNDKTNDDIIVLSLYQY